MPHRILFASLLLALSVLVAPCQQVLPANASRSSGTKGSENTNQPADESKRILGLIPNYRTSPSLQDYQPLTNKEKFRVAYEGVRPRYGRIGGAVRQ